MNRGCSGCDLRARRLRCISVLTMGAAEHPWRVRVPCVMSASLIGRLGSSTFRLSTAPVSMSLTGSCFSSESAPRPFQRGIRGRGATILATALPSDERQVLIYPSDTMLALDYNAVISWLQGFISAQSVLVNDDTSGPVRMKQWMRWLFSYCRTNPNKSIIDAALQLSDTLRQH
jgi:hypothetical protein